MFSMSSGKLIYIIKKYTFLERLFKTIFREVADVLWKTCFTSRTPMEVGRKYFWLRVEHNRGCICVYLSRYLLSHTAKINSFFTCFHTFFARSTSIVSARFMLTLVCEPVCFHDFLDFWIFMKNWPLFQPKIWKNGRKSKIYFRYPYNSISECLTNF